MAAPKKQSTKTTKSAKTTGQPQKLRRSVQIIVFAPANSDMTNDDNLTYMVCPSSLRVLEVVEKLDDEADEYIALLSKDKIKSTVSSKTFIDDLAKAIDIENGLMTSEELDEVNDLNKEELKKVKALNEDGLDEDLIAFATEELGDGIFTDDESEHLASKVSDEEVADMMLDLDKEEDDTDLEGLVSSMDEDGELPEL